MSDVQIKDGAGDGYRTRVNAEHRLLVSAIADTRIHESNHVHQESYTVVLEQTPTAAGDVFYYMKNTHTTKDLNLWLMGIKVATAESVEIYLGATGTPAGGTAVVPVNRTANSGHVAQGTFQAGNDITGLTANPTTPANRIFIPADGLSHPWECPCAIIIPPNSAMYLSATTGAIKINLDMLFEYHDSEEQ